MRLKNIGLQISLTLISIFQYSAEVPAYAGDDLTISSAASGGDLEVPRVGKFQLAVELGLYAASAAVPFLVYAHSPFSGPDPFGPEISAGRQALLGAYYLAGILSTTAEGQIFKAHLKALEVNPKDFVVRGAAIAGSGALAGGACSATLTLLSLFVRNM